MQALEGDIDTSHAGFLHYGHGRRRADTARHLRLLRRCNDERRVTKWSTPSSAPPTAPTGPAEEDKYYWRIANFLFPFYTMIPTGVLGLKRSRCGAWVPVDDDHTMVWGMNLVGEFAGVGGAGGAAASALAGESLFLPNTTDWLGRWRYKQNRANDYLLDPVAQKTNSYTGIDGINQQDQAITESMGALMDRTQEHLGTADVMIIRTRQRILRAARALQEDGTIPPGVDDPDVYAVRTGGLFLHKDADWLEATKELRKAFVDHPDVREQAKAGKF